LVVGRCSGKQFQMLRRLDNQSREQVLLGEVLVISGKAGQICRPVSLWDQGTDAEIEFKRDDGKASGVVISLQLKDGESHLRKLANGTLTFPVRKPWHLDRWRESRTDVYLVLKRSSGLIYWMNVTSYLKAHPYAASIVFTARRFTARALRGVRKELLPTVKTP